MHGGKLTTEVCLGWVLKNDYTSAPTRDSFLILIWPSRERMGLVSTNKPGMVGGARLERCGEFRCLSEEFRCCLDVLLPNNQYAI